jgi:APA family basic amino acid/polyamine antiporter
VREGELTPTEQPLRRFGVLTATALVVANMVGTGVFATTGVILDDVPSAPAMLACWLVAGLAAFSGALAYAELGAAMPCSGGEYYFLSRLFHPALGFVAAWSSLIVGFSAPLAAIAIVFDEYLRAVVPMPPLLTGALLVITLSAVNAWRVSAGAGVQNLFTIAKVVLIVGFIVVGLAFVDSARLSAAERPFGESVTSPGFAVALLEISFAYTGWNAAAYVAGEVREPARVLPVALGLGTLLVTVLYIGLNAVFLAAAPLSELTGQVAVAQVAAVHLWGERGGAVVSVIIAAGLLSTANAIVVTGPRVYEAVGKDLRRLSWLARRRRQGGPRAAIALQALVALAMMSAPFENLLFYIGFTLSIFAALTVLGVYRLRRRADLPRPYQMPGYPVTPALFVALAVWMAIHGVIERPLSALAGLGTVLLGWLVYRLSQ